MQHAEAYKGVKRLRAGGAVVPDRAIREVKLQAKVVLVERRAVYLADPALPGRRTIDAVRPCLADWLGSRGYGLSYHATQVFTGHECFGEYLCRIGKETTTRCHHCDEGRALAQHTLEFCPAWAELRRVLREAVGDDLSLPAIVAAIVGREQKWKAFLSYCGQVMSAKEDAKRIRRGKRAAPAVDPP
ncbi:uncharacterized protein [Temnothorax nylanderi]|uniref:uncharacterized protein n=1 Tax=Temnothorax nylanderi TaxID=102681 RepID=UPI003A87544D